MRDTVKTAGCFSISRDVDALKPVEVKLSPEVEARLVECLKAWNLHAVDANPTKLGATV